MSGTMLWPVGMLTLSSLFMNAAWYWHLKDPGKPLWLAVFLSWGIALFEYALAVPANRMGSAHYSLAQLKTIQEVLSLVGFVVIAWLLFDQRPSLSQLAGFGLIAAGAMLIFRNGVN